MKNSTGLIVWLLIIGFAVARQNYLQSDDDINKIQDWKSNCEICNLFSIWNKVRNDLNTKNYIEYSLPLQEHLMTRKSHRSPSLRLRFGRRDLPKLKTEVMELGSRFKSDNEAV